MTADSPKLYQVFAVVALKRPGFTESIIALRKEEDAARRSARQFMAAMPAAFVRCRVQQMRLTLAEVMAICFRWGQEDARSGEPFLSTLPRGYAEEYRRGYESVGTTPGPVTTTAGEWDIPRSEMGRS